MKAVMFMFGLLFFNVGFKMSRYRFSGLIFTVGILSLIPIGMNGMTFEDYHMYTIRPETLGQLKILHKVKETAGFDFWDVPKMHRASRVMVKRIDARVFEKFLKRYGIYYEQAEKNVQQILDQEKLKIRQRRYKRSIGLDYTVTFKHYWSLEEIYEYIEYLGSFHPMVNSITIGNTHEQRSIKAVTISLDGQITMKRPVVFIDAGIHAREWAGIMAVMYMIHEFAENTRWYGEQLNNTDYVIIPVLNPDGFVYSREVNRLWRKNRVRLHSECVGVDLNRNFPYAWVNSGTMCKPYFAGSRPGSELETRAMMNLMERFKAAVKLYIAVHTHGEMILWPWGYKVVRCDNWREHDHYAKMASNAIKTAGGKQWRVGNSAELMYIASGASDDYAHANGVRLAYTIELTGGGQYGFDLPEEELGKALAQTMQIFKVFGKVAGRSLNSTFP
ncbi:carboxypeptidase B-like [Toxorhynchites rutilus septentrionalis]|uniref:carboxypeptidase B-like n=1 Tax=Toxorhynchites rutilus septentrionalis TaxID=329112 RepID=UPI00247B2C49|nr:carboxypeptidase B-like [Toxorhynchites rutilus septentrionalis]